MPSMAGRSAFVIGFTGSTGKELVKELASSDKFSKVVLIGRRTVEYDSPALQSLVSSWNSHCPSCCKDYQKCIVQAYNMPRYLCVCRFQFVLEIFRCVLGKIGFQIHMGFYRECH